jgi:hypothetical protein
MKNTIRTLTPFIAVCAGLFATLQGCSSSGGSNQTTQQQGNPDAGSPQNVAQQQDDQFSLAFAHAVCDDAAKCCQDNGFKYDEKTCLQVAQRAAKQGVVQPAMTAGAVYDPNAAQECVAKLRQAVQSCSLDDVQSVIVNDTCSRVYAGKKKPGEKCTSSVECAPSPQGRMYCVSWSGDQQAQDGVCLVRKFPAEAGDTCDTSQQHPVIATCETSDLSDFQCDPGTKTCLERKPIGQSCKDAPKSCAKDAYCNTKTNNCEARLAAGATCADPGECNVDTFCDSGSKTCIAKKEKGEACKDASECKSQSCSGGKCLANRVASADLCGGS